MKKKTSSVQPAMAIASKPSAEPHIFGKPSAPVASQTVSSTQIVQLMMRDAFAAQQNGQFDKAKAAYEALLRIDARCLDVHLQLGIVAMHQGQPAQAIDHLKRALQIDPNHALAHYFLGNAFVELQQMGEAKECLERAIAIRPEFIEAHIILSNIFRSMGQFQEAVRCCDRAIALAPQNDKALYSRGMMLMELSQYTQALESLNQAFALSPDTNYLRGNRLFAKLRLCDWSNFNTELHELSEKINAGALAVSPFSALNMLGDARLVYTAARSWVMDQHPARVTLGSITKHPRRERIRIGYFSADLQSHATTHLMVHLFEQHDKNQFEVIAFSFGSFQMEDAMRQRVRQACDAFVNVEHLTAEEIAQRAREMGIDIAIDLKGFTKDARPDIFAYRAAPIQVSYLGYPGTMGASYMDYLLADPVLIPAALQRHYSEKIVYLPHSYQVNDATRAIPVEKFTRHELDLPEQGFVYCCFNNHCKILPPTFDRWMRILQRTPTSVLWLMQGDEMVQGRLRLEAQSRGIAPSRLIFAPRVSVADHLSRHLQADLFIDTLPYNAHTTASDALWAGLPVLTCVGETFASRVAASLLTAIDMTELITSTPVDFENLAVALADDLPRLADIRQRLKDQRKNAPLFDTRRFTRYIESAYAKMMNRYHSDLPPEHFDVPA